MNQRWWVAVCLFLATVINYVDRQTLSVLVPVLTDELKITNVEYSYMVQAFLIPYTFMYIPAGILIDRWGTRAGISMVWWSIATALHGAASSARHLIIYRFLLGVGESGNFLAAEKAVSEWYPPKERGVANGLINAAAGVGAILAPPVIVAIWHSFGWRWAFVSTGLLGLIWLPSWMRVYRNPPQAPSRDRKRAVPWTSLLRHPQSWGLLFARVLADPVWWFYLFWLPKYLKETRGFTMTQIGLLSWIPYVASDAGSILGGVFSGWLVRRHLPVQARRLAMWPCVLLMPLGVLIAYTPSSAVALALICLATFCHMAWKTNLMTLTNDVYPPAILASAAGLVGLGGGLGGAIAAPVFGRLIDAFSYTPVFIIMGFLHPAAMLVVHFAVREPICELSPVSAARA